MRTGHNKEVSVQQQQHKKKKKKKEKRKRKKEERSHQDTTTTQRINKERTKTRREAPGAPRAKKVKNFKKRGA